MTSSHKALHQSPTNPDLLSQLPLDIIAHITQYRGHTSLKPDLSFASLLLQLSHFWYSQIWHLTHSIRINCYFSPDKNMDQLVSFGESFGDLLNITYLDISGNLFNSNAWCDLLKKMKRLKILKMAGLLGVNLMPLLKVVVNGLNMTLQEWHLPGCMLKNEELVYISKNMRVLKRLNIGNCDEVENEGFAEIGRMEQLVALKMNDCEVDDGVFEYLKELSALKELKMFACNVTDKGLAEISVAKGMKKLDLERCYEFSNEGLRNVSESFRELEMLNVNRCNITNEGLQHLSRLSGLSVLKCSFCPFVNTKALEYLSTLTKLRKVCIADWGYVNTNSGMNYLSLLNNLTYLDMVGIRFSTDELKNLTNLTNLKELRISGFLPPEIKSTLHFTNILIKNSL